MGGEGEVCVCVGGGGGGVVGGRCVQCGECTWYYLFEKVFIVYSHDK